MDGWKDFIATHQIFVEPFHSTLFKISSFINKRSVTKEVEWLANIVMSMDNVASNYISASIHRLKILTVHVPMLGKVDKWSNKRKTAFMVLINQKIYILNPFIFLSSLLPISLCTSLPTCVSPSHIASLLQPLSVPLHLLSPVSCSKVFLCV